MSYWNSNVPFSTLVGQVLTGVVGEVGGDEVDFTTETGQYRMYHMQDCCESVYLQDVDGDLQDLKGEVYEAEEVEGENPADHDDEQMDSYMYTFYKIRTAGGSVTLRWLGESNGYYSESVDFVDLNAKD